MQQLVFAVCTSASHVEKHSIHNFTKCNLRAESVHSLNILLLEFYEFYYSQAHLLLGTALADQMCPFARFIISL